MTLSTVAPAAVGCKCCGAEARLYGVVDFHKNCEDRRQPDLLGLSGVPIYYHRCGHCGFLFTAAFDDFSHDDFAAAIYNDEYVRVDPDFPEVRPRANADLVAQLFPDAKDARVLDYGGGTGLLARLLREEKGYARVVTYDPFVPEHSARPDGTFDLVLCFEVVEHVPDPETTFRDVASLLAPDGLVLFSTLVQPADIASHGVGWWYVAPRNGHVSLHSNASLQRLAGRLGFTLGSFHEGLHVLYRQLPGFAAHLRG